jgi:hypothetical protein
MAQLTPLPTESKPNPQEELANLITAASKQPGVQELMQVYQQWKPYEAAMQVHQRYLGIHRVSVVSDSSGEHIFQAK